MIKKEQFYIDLIKHEYNILSNAGSSLGFKHSKETLFKSGRLSDKALHNLKKAKEDSVLSPLAKANMLLSRSHNVTIKNILNNDIMEFSSIRAASIKLKVSHATLLNYINNNQLFKDKYIIKRK